MPASVTAVRAFLTADSHDVPLPSPQPINLASDVIPYGARMRLEAEVQSSEPIHPLSVVGDGGLNFFMYSSGRDTYAAELRLPWDLRLPGELFDLPSPFSLPIQGWPALGGGEYRLKIQLRPTTSGVAGRQLPTFDMSLRLDNPPEPGGARPRIVSLSSGLSDGGVLKGQPWLPTATVEDADNDVVLVVFTVAVANLGRWCFMRDDGRYGDQQAGDGIYSFLRVGGDWWDRGETGWAHDLNATFSVQALDLRGNWSEPARFDYTIRNSQPPIWMQEPAADGPNILEAAASRPDGPPECPLLWARCDSAEAWVCGRMVRFPDEVLALYPMGKGPIPFAGPQVHSTVIWATAPIPRDIIFYAVPQEGPVKIGRKMAVSRPPFV